MYLGITTFVCSILVDAVNADPLAHAEAPNASRLSTSQVLASGSWGLLLVCLILLLASLISAYRGRKRMRILSDTPNSVQLAFAFTRELESKKEFQGSTAGNVRQRLKLIEQKLRADAHEHVTASLWSIAICSNKMLDPHLSLQAVRSFCGVDATRLLQWIAKTSIMAGMFGTIVGLIDVFASLKGGSPNMSMLIPAFQTALSTTACGVPLYIAANSINYLIWGGRIRVISENLAVTMAEISAFLRLRQEFESAVNAKMERHTIQKLSGTIVEELRNSSDRRNQDMASSVMATLPDETDHDVKEGTESYKSEIENQDDRVASPPMVRDVAVAETYGADSAKRNQTQDDLFDDFKTILPVMFG